MQASAAVKQIYASNAVYSFNYFSMAKQFLFIILFLTTVCCRAGSNFGKVDTVHAKTSGREITIMTYNVKLLPRAAVMLHHHPVIRARLIPAKLISENPDVIVFEEAFDGKAVRILKRKLKAQYPYIAGWDNRKLVTYKRAGGVLIFSKYPLKEIESIRYSECKGYDCLGNKGAILVEVEYPLQKFQLLGTHMQAGGSVELKESQYQQAGDLLKRHQQAGIPQFVAGDFNTHKQDTTLYPKLVASLQAQDGSLDDEQALEAGHDQSDMRGKPGAKKHKDGKEIKITSSSKKKKGIIDYIFVKENGVKFTSEERYGREYTQKWSAEHKALSDHFAVILKVTL